jgi:ATP-dependent Lon protease
MEKSQKEYYLNEQMKAIKKELGDEEEKNELSELEKKINEKKLSKEAKEKALGELKKLKMMSPMSAEAGVVRNYLGLDYITPLGRAYNYKQRYKQGRRYSERRSLQP